MKNDVITVTEEELSLVNINVLNSNQLGFIMKRTPKKYIRQRPKQGGGMVNYVAGGYMKKVLNLMFGWDWDFEVIWEQVFDEEVVVKGKLTCRAHNKVIVKTQYGKKAIVRLKKNNKPVSIGNDFKSAATDALKKCASELGIASDVYSPEEFREIEIEIKKDDKKKEAKTKKEAKSMVSECQNEKELLSCLDSLGVLSFDEEVIEVYEKRKNELKQKS